MKLPSELHTNKNLGSRDVGSLALTKRFMRILDGEGIPADSATSVITFIFKGNIDIINYRIYTGVRLLEHVKTEISASYFGVHSLQKSTTSSSTLKVGLTVAVEANA